MSDTAGAREPLRVGPSLIARLNRRILGWMSPERVGQGQPAEGRGARE